jgi:hypothetical protein
VKVIGLLAFMLGAAKTASGPVVAPDAIVALIDVLLHVLMVSSVPFSITALLPCEVPNPVPEITTWLPTGPVVAETVLITGAGTAAELTDTLSSVAVANRAVLPLLTPRPMYTLLAMLIVWLESCTQFTPSEEIEALTVLPLRTRLTQYGKLTAPDPTEAMFPPVLVR